MAKGDFAQYFFSSVGAGLVFWFLSKVEMGAKVMSWIVDMMVKIPGFSDVSVWYFEVVKYIVIGLVAVGAGFLLAESIRKYK